MTGLAIVVLIYLLVFVYGQRITSGVVEEKSSRVVEVLLASARPSQLLTGKVLEMGVMAFAQVAALLATFFVVATATGSALLDGAALGVVLVGALWVGGTPSRRDRRARPGAAWLAAWARLGRGRVRAAALRGGGLADRLLDLLADLSGQPERGRLALSGPRRKRPVEPPQPPLDPARAVPHARRLRARQRCGGLGFVRQRLGRVVGQSQVGGIADVSLDHRGMTRAARTTNRFSRGPFVVAAITSRQISSMTSAPPAEAANTVEMSDEQLA